MTVTCSKCGWVHFAVTRKRAEEEVAAFNAYFAALSPQQQQDYYGGTGSSLDRYEACWCGSTQFQPSKPGDCPDGCTLNPVIYEEKP